MTAGASSGLTSRSSPGIPPGMNPEEKVREARVRRALRRRGLELSRSRRRDPGALDYGRYAIRGRAGQVIDDGITSLDELEQWVLEWDAKPERTS
jgi:hypothetical protein